MLFFRNSNASKASFSSTSSSAPLRPTPESVFDSSSSKSPLFSPNYQVPVYSLADSVAILRQNSQSASKTKKKSTKVSEKPNVSENETATAALKRMQRSGGGMPNLTMV